MIGWMFLVFIIIGAVAGLLFAIFEGIGEVVDCILGVIIGGLIGTLVALLVFLGIGLAACTAEYEIVENPVAQYEVYSLKDNYGVDG